MPAAIAMTSREKSDSSMPDLALGDAVAHGGDAAGDLRGAAHGPGGVADQGGVALVGLMGREHVVVGGDDAEVAGALGDEGRLVAVGHRRVGVGLVAAGEVGALRALVAGAGHAVEVVAADRGASARRCGR